MDLEGSSSSSSIEGNMLRVIQDEAYKMRSMTAMSGTDTTSTESGSSLSDSTSPFDSPRLSPSNLSSTSSSSSPSLNGKVDLISECAEFNDLPQFTEYKAMNVPYHTPAVKKALSEEIDLALRPDDGGTEGRVISIKANVFMMNFPKNMDIHHYDIEILTCNGDDTKKEKVKKTEKREFFNAFHAQHQYIFGNSRGGVAFDGEKNFYTNHLLDIGRRWQGNVTWNRDNVKVVVQWTATINTMVLNQFLEQHSTDITPDAIDCINAFNIVLRHNPALQHVTAGHSFFPSPNGRCVALGAGLELWPGYHQSVRHSQLWKPIMNIDVANTAFYKEQTVIEFMKETLKLRENIRPNLLTRRDLLRFEKSLKGVKVEPTHRSGVIRRWKVMQITSTGADHCMFESESGKLSVAQYFAKQYGKLKYPYLPCAVVGNKGQMVPFEHLRVAPRQRYSKKLGEQQLATLIRSVARPADERAKSIENWVREADINRDPCARAFGLSMDPNMIALKGRVLEPPKMEYAQKQYARPNKGTWDIGRGNFQFKKGAPLEEWGIISFADVKTYEIKQFVSALQNQGDQVGMEINHPKKAIMANRPDELHDIFNNFYEKMPDLQLIFIIAQRKDNYLYAETKRVGDTQVGIMTQVLCQATMSKAVKNPATLINILLKINAKLGGQNVSIPSRIRSAIMSDPVIVLGADVTHPASGELDKPSIAAIVGSVDPVPSKYVATVSVQERRVEYIADTKEMVKKLLIRFYKKNKAKPLRIVMFRDGVGEGMFKMILQHELKAIRAACKDLEPDGNYEPGITFVCVQKRHHMRLFCQDQRDMVGKSNNIPAGTVVDSSICHPSQYDFYLCSHAGIQGTSRPTHYHVLHDDNGYKSDLLQNFTYQLCHTYVRCSRSVSIPAPTYYAHLVAFRARYHMQAIIDRDSDTASTNSGYRGGSRPVLDQKQLRRLDKLITIHSNISCRMYFA